MAAKKTREPGTSTEGRKPRDARAADTGTGQSTSPATQDRLQMIAEAAYFMAARRGFTGGDPVADWLAAEREISRIMPTAKLQKEELAAYEKLRSELTELLTAMRGTVNQENIRHAFDTAQEKIRTAGIYAAETISKVAETTKKDIANLASEMGPEWEKYSDKTAGIFGVWRDRGSAYIATAAKAVGEWLQQMGAKAERQVYRSGEVTYGGVLECTGCGKRIKLDTAAHVPLCPGCRNGTFRRIEAMKQDVP